MENLHQQLSNLIEEAIFETPEHINGLWLSARNYNKLIQLINKVETLECEAKLWKEHSDEIFERDQKLVGQIISKLLDV